MFRISQITGYLAVISALLIGGCITKLPGDPAITHNYCGDYYLQIYQPSEQANPDKRPLPVVLHFPGSSGQNYISANTGFNLFTSTALQAINTGFIGVLVDVPVVNSSQPRNYVDAAACAVRWIRDHAYVYDAQGNYREDQPATRDGKDRYPIDISKIGVVGYSSGAAVAMAVALVDRDQRDAENKSDYDHWTDKILAAGGSTWSTGMNGENTHYFDDPDYEGELHGEIPSNIQGSVVKAAGADYLGTFSGCAAVNQSVYSVLDNIPGGAGFARIIDENVCATGYVPPTEGEEFGHYIEKIDKPYVSEEEAKNECKEGSIYSTWRAGFSETLAKSFVGSTWWQAEPADEGQAINCVVSKEANQLYSALSPTNFVQGDYHPAIMYIHGLIDTSVSYEGSLTAGRYLKKASEERIVKSVFFDELGHGNIDPNTGYLVWAFFHTLFDGQNIPSTPAQFELAFDESVDTSNKYAHSNQLFCSSDKYQRCCDQLGTQGQVDEVSNCMLRYHPNQPAPMTISAMTMSSKTMTSFSLNEPPQMMTTSSSQDNPLITSNANLLSVWRDYELAVPIFIEEKYPNFLQCNPAGGSCDGFICDNELNDSYETTQQCEDDGHGWIAWSINTNTTTGISVQTLEYHGYESVHYAATGKVITTYDSTGSGVSSSNATLGGQQIMISGSATGSIDVNVSINNLKATGGTYQVTCTSGLCSGVTETLVGPDWIVHETNACSTNQAFDVGVQSHGSTGTVALGNWSYIYETGNVLPATIVSQGRWFNTKPCGDGFCSASGTPVSALDAGTFQTTTSTRDISVVAQGTGSGGVVTEFGEVSIGHHASFSFDAPIGSTYKIRDLNTGIDGYSTVEFTPGDYWIENLYLGWKNNIKVKGAGTVRLFIKNTPYVGPYSLWNRGAGTLPERLVVFSYDGFSPERGEYSGFFYSKANMRFAQWSTLSGSFTGDNLFIGPNSVVYGKEESVGNVDFGKYICSGIN